MHRISGVWETIIIGKFMKIASTKLSYFCHNSLMRTEDFFLRGTGSSYRKYCFNKDYFDCWPFHMNHLAFLKYEIWIFVYAKLIKNSALFLFGKTFTNISTCGLHRCSASNRGLEEFEKPATARKHNAKHVKIGTSAPSYENRRVHKAWSIEQLNLSNKQVLCVKLITDKLNSTVWSRQFM